MTDEELNSIGAEIVMRLRKSCDTPGDAASVLIYCLLAMWKYRSPEMRGKFEDFINAFRDHSLATYESNQPTEHMATPVSAKSDEKPKPFHILQTREERKDWFALTSPWNRVVPSVIDAVLNGIGDKVLLEAFVLSSMERNLVAIRESWSRK
jgi:hypothetical protein